MKNVQFFFGLILVFLALSSSTDRHSAIGPPTPFDQTDSVSVLEFREWIKDSVTSPVMVCLVDAELIFLTMTKCYNGIEFTFSENAKPEFVSANQLIYGNVTLFSCGSPTHLFQVQAVFESRTINLREKYTDEWQDSKQFIPAYCTKIQIQSKAP